MGFDLHGSNPKINKELDDTTLYGMIDALPNSSKEDFAKKWDIMDNFSDEERKEYHKQYDEHHDDNPGIYFRNNVWWWRPLWDFVAYVCEDFLTEKDLQGGSYNDGYEISEDKALKIAKRLEKAVKNGIADDYSDMIKSRHKIQAKSKDKDVKFMSNYPYDVENVERFALFCKESGGFQIC